MKRREFITLLAGAAAAWPLAARAQQSVMPVIGYLDAASASDRTYIVAAFRQGLADTGYVEGQNVAIEYRWAEGDYGRLSQMAAELVRQQVSLIVTPGAAAGALAAKNATTAIPIVFAVSSTPAHRVRSKRPSQRWRRSEPMHFLSVPARSSMLGESSLSCWRHITGFHRPIRSARMPKQVD
jgi:ABC-type uncharacterized transport system substrate-binding protein